MHDLNIITGTFVCEKQLQTYLRLANCPVGLLLNFNETLLKNGLKRVVNRLPEPCPRTPLPRVLRVNDVDSALMPELAAIFFVRVPIS
jgi:hypothetical protein